MRGRLIEALPAVFKQSLTLLQSGVKRYGRHFEDRGRFTNYWNNDAYKKLKDYDKRNQIRRRILNDIRLGLR